MASTLVTGPANAEKAGYVLSGYRAALDAGRAPLLVVPTRADADHYRRELAAGGAVFGVRVLRFGDLLGEMARRAGLADRPLSGLARERVAAAAIAGTRLRRLAAAAGTPGFLEAFLALVDELGEARVEPARWYSALRRWAHEAPDQDDLAEELAALYSAYRRALEALGRCDARTHAIAALDALRREPRRWGGVPVLVYGFDDLTALQRDALETLAVHCRSEVTVSLTYEPGRAAFASRGATFQELLALGFRHVALPAADGAGALHAIERGLFEPDPASAPPGGAVLALEGGGVRAELELVAAHVARLLGGGGMAPDEVAVVMREPREAAALVEEVFSAAGVPVAIERRVPAGHTALGRGLVALLRCALLDGCADDLLAWLRTPGKLERPELADGLEARVRRQGAVTAQAARALWEGAHPGFALHEVDGVATAASRGPAPLYERLDAETRSLTSAPWRGQARVLAGPEALEVRVGSALRAALGELRALAERDPALAPQHSELAGILERVEVPVGGAVPGGVEVTSPLRIRARRVRALFLCGVQDGAFPRPGRPEPFLGDAERRAINAASGLRLRLREERLDGERFLLYTAVSRPTELVALSWHAAGDDGAPAVRSPFADDVLDLLDPAPPVVRRALGAAGFEDPALAPGARDLLRARLAASGAGRADPPVSIAPLRDPAVLAGLRARERWSGSGLEAWTGCPVRWFVERLLRPEPLSPDPEPMVRGALAHRVLQEAIGELVNGGGRLVPERLEEARRHLHGALERHAGDTPLSVNPQRLRAALRRLEADLLRYLDHAAHAGSALTPAHFELRFGAPGDEHPPALLAGGRLALEGRIDRVDIGGGEAIVYDYKGKTAPPQARWLADGRLQVGLYMLALRQLIGLDPVGGLYQPLGGDEPRARGALLEDADPGLAAVPSDRLERAALDALLDGVLQVALRAQREIRGGELEPRPDGCAWKGGCLYPSICRCER